MTIKRVLLDANVLIALHFLEHPRHVLASQWLGQRPFATTPSTQGSLLRFALRVADPDRASAVIEGLQQSKRHEFWPDDLAYSSETLIAVRGHRQLTDAYLAQVAVAHNARLATFDGGLKTLRPDEVDLIA